MNPYSELIDQINANCIGQSTLHSVLSRRHYELQRETHNVLCILTFLVMVIAVGLIALELRLCKALDSAPVIEPGDRPAEVHRYVPRFDPALPETPNFEKPVPQPYAA